MSSSGPVGALHADPERRRVYLRRRGITPQKPIRRAYDQNPVAVRRWLSETYPLITDRAKQEAAEIHWGDGTGVRSDDARARGYAPPEARRRSAASPPAGTA